MLISSLATPLSASAATPAQCTRAWDQQKSAHVSSTDSYRTFMIACLRNQVSPTLTTVDRSAAAPSRATARCRDGFYSYNGDPALACAQHRGVQAWLR